MFDGTVKLGGSDEVVPMLNVRKAGLVDVANVTR